MSEICLMFTSVGRRVELIRHFLRFADCQPGRVRIIGTEIDRNAPAAQELGSGLRLVPRSDSPQFLDSVRALCEQERVSAIFPLIDPDVFAFSQIDLQRGTLSSEAGAIVSDKWLTYQWLSERSIPTIPTWLPSGDGAEAPAFPLFMKPRHGSAAENSFIVRDAAEYAFFTTYIPDPVAQVFLPGPEVTVDVVVGSSGKVLGLAQRRRLAVRGGEVTRAEIVRTPEVSRLSRTIANGLAVRCPITIQGMFDPAGDFLVSEINGRLGGGMPLAVAAGMPLAELLVNSWSGGDPHEFAESDLAVGLQMARYDAAHFFTPRGKA